MPSITLRLIKDEQDYTATLERITQLFDAKPGTSEGYEFEILLLLVDHYQRKHQLLPEVEPLEVITFVMQQRGLTLQDISPYLGGEEMASQILSGKRGLTPQMIRALADNLRIPANALI